MRELSFLLAICLLTLSVYSVPTFAGKTNAAEATQVFDFELETEGEGGEHNKQYLAEQRALALYPKIGATTAVLLLLSSSLLSAAILRHLIYSRKNKRAAAAAQHANRILKTLVLDGARQRHAVEA
jgi:hypothetical protein